MKFHGQRCKLFKILIMISFIAPSMASIFLMHNSSVGLERFSHTNISTVKVTLEVVCDEQTGFCELVKALPDEQKDEFRLASSPTPIRESIYCQTLIEISYLSISTVNPIQSYIKIADTPPPIFNS